MTARCPQCGHDLNDWEQFPIKLRKEPQQRLEWSTALENSPRSMMEECAREVASWPEWKRGSR